MRIIVLLSDQVTILLIKPPLHNTATRGSNDIASRFTLFQTYFALSFNDNGKNCQFFARTNLLLLIPFVGTVRRSGVHRDTILTLFWRISPRTVRMSANALSVEWTKAATTTFIEALQQHPSNRRVDRNLRALSFNVSLNIMQEILPNINIAEIKKKSTGSETCRQLIPCVIGRRKCTLPIASFDGKQWHCSPRVAVLCNRGLIRLHTQLVTPNHWLVTQRMNNR